MVAALVFFLLQNVQAQEVEAYDCQYTSGDKGVIHLEDAFSSEQNMRVGSVTIKNPNQVTVRWDTRVYQFLLPDNQRYVQMWYLSNDFRVDGQMMVAGSNMQFAATLKNLNSQHPLLCRKK